MHAVTTTTEIKLDVVDVACLFDWVVSWQNHLRWTESWLDINCTLYQDVVSVTAFEHYAFDRCDISPLTNSSWCLEMKEYWVMNKTVIQLSVILSCHCRHIRA